MKLLPLLFSLACAAFALTAGAAETPRPNIVILLADDQGWGDLSFNGNTNLRTPKIDALGRARARCSTGSSSARSARRPGRSS